MKIEELDKLIKLATRLQEEPDIEEFDENDVLDDFIDLVKLYKDFLHEDEDMGRERYQYSEIPIFFSLDSVIKVVNENFEKQQKAIYKLLDEVSKLNNK